MSEPTRLPSVELLIVGTPRSGTTLLQRLAIESCHLRGVPETSYFSVFPPLLRKGRVASRERTRQHLVDALEEYSRSSYLEGAGLDPAEVTALLEGRKVDVFDIFEAVVAALAGGPDRLCEKTPGHLWWWEPIAAARPSARFAIIVRDPRASIASLMETGFADQSLAGYVEWWRHDQHVVEQARRRLGPRCLVLRYEDVVADESVTRRLLAELCGSGQSRATYIRDASREENAALALPWETWKAGYDGPVTTDRIESWRNRLTEDEITYIERATATEMQRWGYEPVRTTDATPTSVRRAMRRSERLVSRARIDVYRLRRRYLLASTVDLR